MTTKVSKENNLLQEFLTLKSDVEQIGTAVSLQEAGALKNGFLSHVLAHQNLMQRSAQLRSTHKELDTSLQQLSSRVNAAWEQIAPSELQRAILSHDIQTLENIAKVSHLQNTKLANRELSLHFAIRRGCDPVVRWLIQTFRFNLSLKDHQGLTAIDHALLTNNPKMIALVLGAALGTEIPEAAVSRPPALRKWALFTHPSIRILRFPLPLPTPLILLGAALFQEMQKLRRPLVSHLHPLHAAAFLGQTKEIEILLKKEPPEKRLGFLNHADAAGMTAIHYAALGGKEEVVKFLLKQGVKVDGKLANGMTALHLAAISDSAATLQELLNTGNFDPNAPDAKGRAPLHFAVLSEKLSAAKALIQKGADLFVQTPLETPFTLLRAAIEERRNNRDSLKISNTTLLSFCALTASRIAYLLGDYTSGRFLGSLPVCGMMIQNMLTGSSILRHMAAGMGLDGITGVFVSNSLPYTLFPSIWHTLSFGKTFTQNIRSAWKNRHLEVFRPLRNILIHGANTCFTGWNNLYEPMALLYRNEQLKKQKYQEEIVQQMEKMIEFANETREFYCKKDPKCPEIQKMQKLLEFVKTHREGFFENWLYNLSVEFDKNWNHFIRNPQSLCSEKGDLDCILSLSPEDYPWHAAHVALMGDHKTLALQFHPDKYGAGPLRKAYEQAMAKINTVHDRVEECWLNGDATNQEIDAFCSQFQEHYGQPLTKFLGIKPRASTRGLQPPPKQGEALPLGNG